MAVSDEAILRALCCGGVCVRPGGCSVDGRRPRNLLVYLDDALPALRALFEQPDVPLVADVTEADLAALRSDLDLPAVSFCRTWAAKGVERAVQPLRDGDHPV